VGVALGGALSLFAQRSVEESAGRRHIASLIEGRRAERLSHLVAFIEIAQEAERLAIAIHKHEAAGDATDERADAVLDRLWTRLRAVQLICPADVGEAARTGGRGARCRQARTGRSVGDGRLEAESRETDGRRASRPRTDLTAAADDGHLSLARASTLVRGVVFVGQVPWPLEQCEL
jgi:hypothetical protein